MRQGNRRWTRIDADTTARRDGRLRLPQEHALAVRQSASIGVRLRLPGLRFSPFILNILCIPVRRCLVGFVSHACRLWAGSCRAKG